jgi:hypothetical protein
MLAWQPTAAVVAGVSGVMDSQLVMNPGCLFLRHSQVRGYSEKAPSQRLGLVAQFARVSCLAGDFPLTVGGGPVDLRLVPIRAGVRAVERRLVAVKTVTAARQQLTRTRDRLMPAPELDQRSVTQLMR